MSEQEKAAGMLDTSAAAFQSKRTPILGPQRLDRNEFETLCERFGRRGYTLQRVFRADDGRVTYHVSRTVGTRIFSHPHDLGAFLAVAEAAAV